LSPIVLVGRLSNYATEGEEGHPAIDQLLFVSSNLPVLGRGRDIILNAVGELLP
jgi:hypothetical protein